MSGERTHLATVEVDSVQFTNLSNGEAGGWPTAAVFSIDTAPVGDGSELERTHFQLKLPDAPVSLVGWIGDNALPGAVWQARGWVPQELVPFPAGVRPVVAVMRMGDVSVVADADGVVVSGSAVQRYEFEPLWAAANDDAELDDLLEVDLDV